MKNKRYIDLVQRNLIFILLEAIYFLLTTSVVLWEAICRRKSIHERPFAIFGIRLFRLTPQTPHRPHSAAACSLASLLYLFFFLLHTTPLAAEHLNSILRRAWKGHVRWRASSPSPPHRRPRGGAARPQPWWSSSSSSLSSFPSTSSSVSTDASLPVSLPFALPLFLFS